MRRKVRAQLGDRGGRVAQDRRDDVDGARALERPVAGQHLVEHDAEREDVRPRVDLAAPRLLGGHVGDRAEDRPSPVRLGAALRRQCSVTFGIGVRGLELGEPEVEDLDAVPRA